MRLLTAILCLSVWGSTGIAMEREPSTMIAHQLGQVFRDRFYDVKKEVCKADAHFFEWSDYCHYDRPLKVSDMINTALPEMNKYIKNSRCGPQYIRKDGASCGCLFRADRR